MFITDSFLLDSFLILWAATCIVILIRTKNIIYGVGGGFVVVTVLFTLYGFVYGKPTEQQPLPMPNVSEQPEEVQKLVTENWDALLEQCPGLTKYQDDLAFSKISTYSERVDLEFVVNNSTKKIPESYKAWGHHCFFSLYPHNKTLAISKRACASVCLQKNMFLPENSYLIQPDGYMTSLIN